MEINNQSAAEFFCDDDVIFQRLLMSKTLDTLYFRLFQSEITEFRLNLYFLAFLYFARQIFDEARRVISRNVSEQNATKRPPKSPFYFFGDSSFKSFEKTQHL